MNSFRLKTVSAAAALCVCSSLLVASPAGAVTAAQQAATDLGNGDGAGAAAIIAHAGFAKQPVQLAGIIYQGGLKAVARHNGDAYAKAVAYAFVHGGVSLLTVSETFGVAGTEAVAGGLTTEEAAAGVEAIVLTYAAYLRGGRIV